MEFTDVGLSKAASKEESERANRNQTLKKQQMRRWEGQGEEAHTEDKARTVT